MKWKKENKSKLEAGMNLGPGGGPIEMGSPVPSHPGDHRASV